MPPASLIRKVMEHELSESKKSKEKNKNKNKNNKKKAGPAVPKRKSTATKNNNSKKAASASAASSARSKAKTTKKTAKNSGKNPKSKSKTTKAKVKSAKKLAVRIESSPNARALCRSCNQRIGKNKQRLGIPYGSSYRYYHVVCIPQKLRNTLPQNILRRLPPLKSGSALRKENQQNAREAILLQRSKLVSTLKTRYCRFFTDEVINNLAIALPSNDVELSKLIADCRYVSEDLLRDIRNFVNAKKAQTLTEATETENSRTLGAMRQANNSPKVIVIDDSDEEDNRNIDQEDNMAPETLKYNSGKDGDKDDGDDDDDNEIAVEETLTCAQVVQQKFNRAAANGEIVTID